MSELGQKPHLKIPPAAQRERYRPAPTRQISPIAQPYFSFINKIPPAKTIVMAFDSDQRRVSGKEAIQKPKHDAEHHDEEHSQRNVFSRAGSPDLYELRGKGEARAGCGSKSQQLDCNMFHGRGYSVDSKRH